MKLLHSGIPFRSFASLALALFLMSTTKAGAATPADTAKVDTAEVFTFPYVVNNETKRAPMPNGYHFEMWKQKAGTVKMTVPNDEAKFTVEWTNINNFVARVGLKFDETKKHTDIGTITADLAFEGSGVQGSGLAYYGIYGWTVDSTIKADSTVEYSLVEFYVMEDWDNWRPQAGQGDHVLLGNITVDGRQYEVIKRQMQNQPSIKGTASFPQVFSIRKQPSMNGAVSISEHFKQWEKLGVKLGNLYEVKIKVESYSENNQSSGSCKVTKGVIKLNGQIPTGISSAPRLVTPDSYSLSAHGTTEGMYTLISLTGQKVGSMASTLSTPAVFTTNNVAPGLYYLQFQGKGIAPVVRPLVVK